MASRLKRKRPNIKIAKASQKSITQDFTSPVGEGFFPASPRAGAVFAGTFVPVTLRTATN
jgi:hypothetical protein